MAKIYTGKRTKDGVEVRIIHPQEDIEGFVSGSLPHIPFHSPTGFEWGYGGSGPADLALAILVDFLDEHLPSESWEDPTFSQRIGKSKAWRYHQPFKWAFVAGFADKWELYDTQIEQWLKEQEAK